MVFVRTFFFWSSVFCRSVEFLHVPSSYYDMLEERLKTSKVELREDMAKVGGKTILCVICSCTATSVKI